MKTFKRPLCFKASLLDLIFASLIRRCKSSTFQKDIAKFLFSFVGNFPGRQISAGKHIS